VTEPAYPQISAIKQAMLDFQAGRFGRIEVAETA